MPETLTISIAHPIAALRVMTDGDGSTSIHSTASPPPSVAATAPPRSQQGAEVPEQRLRQLCEVIDSIVGKLNKLYEQTIARNRSDIARLAVEIARKILACKISKGDYDIRPVIEEALKRVPARQEFVVRVNPEDLPLCQQLRQDNPDSQLANINLVADWSIARADCLIETPKGIVKSFVEEHLARIAEALEKAQ
jgi:flagellar biosynthesis/type III secretory pathway protein FliH